MQNKIYKCNICGHDELITSLNKYEVYKIINEQLKLISTELVDDNIKLFCRNCSKEVDINHVLTSNKESDNFINN